MATLLGKSLGKSRGKLLGKDIVPPEQSFGSIAKSFGAGAVKGATLGFFEPEVETPDTTAERVAHTVGEFGGFIVPLIAGGGLVRGGLGALAARSDLPLKVARSAFLTEPLTFAGVEALRRDETTTAGERAAHGAVLGLAAGGILKGVGRIVKNLKTAPLPEKAVAMMQEFNMSPESAEFIARGLQRDIKAGMSESEIIKKVGKQVDDLINRGKGKSTEAQEFAADTVAELEARANLPIEQRIQLRESPEVRAIQQDFVRGKYFDESLELTSEGAKNPTLVAVASPKSPTEVVRARQSPVPNSADEGFEGMPDGLKSLIRDEIEGPIPDLDANLVTMGEAAVGAAIARNVSQNARRTAPKLIMPKKVSIPAELSVAGKYTLGPPTTSKILGRTERDLFIGDERVGNLFYNIQDDSLHVGFIGGKSGKLPLSVNDVQELKRILVAENPSVRKITGLRDNALTPETITPETRALPVFGPAEATSVTRLPKSLAAGVKSPKIGDLTPITPETRIVPELNPTSASESLEAINDSIGASRQAFDRLSEIMTKLDAKAPVASLSDATGLPYHEAQTLYSELISRIRNTRAMGFEVFEGHVVPKNLGPEFKALEAAAPVANPRQLGQPVTEEWLNGILQHHGVTVDQFRARSDLIMTTGQLTKKGRDVLHAMNPDFERAVLPGTEGLGPMRNGFDINSPEGRQVWASILGRGASTVPLPKKLMEQGLMGINLNDAITRANPLVRKLGSGFQFTEHGAATLSAKPGSIYERISLAANRRFETTIGPGGESSTTGGRLGESFQGLSRKEALARNKELAVKAKIMTDEFKSIRQMKGCVRPDGN